MPPRSAAPGDDLDDDVMAVTGSPRQAGRRQAGTFPELRSNVQFGPPFNILS